MMKPVMVMVACLGMLPDGLGQAKAAPGHFETFFTVQKKWLALPVKNGAPKRKVDLWIDGQHPRSIEIELAEDTITYNTGKQVLVCDGVEAPALLSKGRLRLIILADRTGFEIFSADGTLFMPVNVNLDMNQQEIAVSASGGKARLEQAVVYGLKSIWE